MHERHDLDLVAAFARGTLEDPTPARELIESCPDCAEYYEDNLLILEAVRNDLTPRLTDLERRRLRQSIWTEIDGSQTGPAAERVTWRSGAWWYRMAGAVAVLAAVVAVGGVLLGGRGGDMALESTTAELPRSEEETAIAAATTAAADEFTPMAADGGASATTAAAADDTEQAGAPEEATTDRALRAFSAPDLPEVVAEFLDRVTGGEVGIERPFACEAEVDTEQLLAAEAAEMDGDRVWFFAFGNQEEPSVQVLRSEDCSVVYPNG